MTEFASFNVALGRHPKNPYDSHAFQYLCNVYRSVPKNFIREYLNTYHGLLIPTFVIFKKSLKEDGGRLILNKNEIPRANPLNEVMKIVSNDECFNTDLEILKNPQKVKEYNSEYVARSTTFPYQQPVPFIADSNPFTNPPNNPVLPSYPSQPNFVPEEDKQNCNECYESKPESIFVNCTAGHFICRHCLKDQAMQIIKRKKRLRLECRGGPESDPCSGIFDYGDVQQQLAPDQYSQLVALDVFNPETGKKGKEKERVEEPQIPKLTMKEMDDRGWLCPISRELMRNPFQCDQDGMTYELANLREFYNEFHMSPVTFEDLKSLSYKADDRMALDIATYLSVYPE